MDVRYVSDRPKATAAYYDAIASALGEFTFLSPVLLPAWSAAVCTWIRAGEVVAELGAGVGDLMTSALIAPTRIKTYWAFDISGEMIASVSRRLDPGQARLARFIQCDVGADDVGHYTGEGAVDRLIAVNVLQDVSAAILVGNAFRALKVGGQIRATMIRRETHDEFWIEDEGYDEATGRLYTFSRLHESVNAAPLGFMDVRSGSRPFYRVQQFYREDEAMRLFAEAGFVIERLETVAFPIEVVLERWSSKYHRVELTARQIALLDRWGSFPDSYDIVATKPAVDGCV
jgi:hypothetical protein